MKKVVIFVIIATMLLRGLASFCYAEEVPSVSARSAVLMDADTGQVLSSHNAYERMGMASTTKIMTALTVLSMCAPTDTVTVAKEAVGTEGSSVYLCEGEKMTVEHLLYALLLSSANDAAVALAIHCAGSVEQFADRMNDLASQMQLEDTHFTNPHGLYDEDHYTTAYELALITREAMKNGLLSKIFATYKATVPFCGEADKRLLVNHNKMLRSYDGAIGVKTGFTKKTGRCLVSAAKREGLTLICVTLGAPDDWRDHTALLDYGYENFCRRTFADVGEYSCTIPVTGGVSEYVTLTNTEPLTLTLPKVDVCERYLVEATSQFLYAPLENGEIRATVTVTCADKTVSSPLAVKEAVTATPEKGFFKKIWDIFKKD